MLLRIVTEDYFSSRYQVKVGLSIKNGERTWRSPFLSFGFLGFAQDAINSGAAYRALALRHTTTRVRNVYCSFELTLLFALNAVGLTLICFSHLFLRSSQGSSTCECPHHTPATRSKRRNPRSFEVISSDKPCNKSDLSPN